MGASRAAVLLLGGALLASAACSSSPPGQARLRPSLELRQADGGQVAYELGQPVPTFDLEPRARIDLSGVWRFQPAPLDAGLSFADRNSGARRALTAEAGARLQDAFDDSGWGELPVPGTFSPPPSGHVASGWYRERFTAPDGWDTKATLMFQSVGYVADIWLNGRYLGYHEGAWTPFAMDASDALRPGAANTLVVRVDDPTWGTRLDIVPWGLADWWNYGGITGAVWIEGTPELSLVRADVTPHLDGADVSIVLQNRGSAHDELSLITEVLPTSVGDGNLTDPDPRHLVPEAATPVASQVTSLDPMPGGEVRRVSAQFVIRRADLWSPLRPALYVLRAALVGPQGIADQLYETFGLRQVRVDGVAARLLLNGAPVTFHGVALHDERVGPASGGRPAGGPATEAADAFEALRRAHDIGADLIRADHHPASPQLLGLADRLGFAVWEEIPLYHYTPETFQVAMDRRVAPQMLAEMALRDMNHPSVLFHGLANESAGGSERSAALVALRDLDRRLDGTRLTGQAAYGSDPDDGTSADLDVAGYTLYYGVFYGGPLAAATIADALDRFHVRYPHKPVMILEFGRWADSPAEEPEQTRVFEVTYGQLAQRFDTLPGGYVAAAVWWTLDDYWTQRPGIQVEHFGLYRPDGSLRPVGTVVAQAYAAESGPAQR
ncbi:MAG TPA: glycoside hydrolase family 2 TIM barrel-domain containing protein, partial [Candidatus Eisenbacteria bacterium]|nr:glycoside hydrolase family 2 TIM barrel-domain containing protein [Candidatus Eisenbacteria bacterium]